MKKFILPLIFILYLTFILTGFGADLFGTYDYRIKLTIDNTKIDAALTWFPVAVLLTSTAGEEVFVEFDADADFDRVAFTKSDGTTELYADCEKFDDSAQIAIYHISRDGWAVASGADTDFYMYYDDDAAHNTTYVGGSGGTAAQSVYDADFKAVYHMTDYSSRADLYDTQYEATVEPDSDGWSLGGTDYSSVSSGILTIDTSGNDTYTCYYTKSPNVDFDAGFYLKTRIKAHTDMNAVDDYILIRADDGTQNERVELRIRRADIQWIYNGDNFGNTALDTTTSYVMYEIYAKGSTFWIYADGVQKATNTIDAEAVSDRIIFGDAGSGTMCKIEIDYLYYALDVTHSPVTDLAIMDSTSNNNDATKKGSDEPIEATGKVGQGQDGDGTNDYITLGAQPMSGEGANITVEMCIEPDSLVANDFILGMSGGDKGFSWRVDDVDNTLLDFYIEDGGTSRHCIEKTHGMSLDIWYYLTATYDGTTQEMFKNAVSLGTDSDTFVPDWESATYQIFTSWADHAFDGVMDEVRVSKTTRADAWIKATYNSLWNSLLTYGSEETSGVTYNAIFFGVNF